MKLIKFLSQSGIGTRRECETIIKSKQIFVNGKICEDFNFEINPKSDSIKYNNKKIIQSAKVYIALHKPTGYVSTVRDEQQRPTVLDLIKRKKGKLFPVGRLDYNTEGLIFITNDGDWANKIIHPNNSISKVYSVRVHGENLKQNILKLRSGIQHNRKIIKPDKVLIKKMNPKSGWIEITIHSGENKIIRRLCEENNMKISRLIRTKIGNFKLLGLKKGDYRILDYKEINAIF
jgi:23S rRNA pseudouridine2605 synthase